MKLNVNFIFFFICLAITIFISDFIDTGHKLDNLRGNVLRLHILANSDSDDDQQLKLCVRDALLENADEVFGNCDTLENAVENAENALGKAEEIAENVVREKGYDYEVSAEIDDMYFTERHYGEITMPQGMYKALRIKIGEAKGHNWWCVMYPPLCLPMADKVVDSEEVKEEFFTDDEIEIMEKPKKFRVRFMLWDKLKACFFDKKEDIS